MPSKARCKFRVTRVSEMQWGREIQLEAQYDSPLSEEDEAFSGATPTGEMTFMVENPALDGFFEPGKDFYIDLIPVD